MPQYFLLSLILWGWMDTVHPFYISLTDIRYNAKNRSIEIAQKIFWDDLEVALSSENGTKVDFLKPEDEKKLHSMVKKYLLEQNKIKVNGKDIQLNFLGYEIEEDAAWFYMEGENIPVPKTVVIKNSLLFEDFPTQQNIVNFYMDYKPKSLVTNKNKQQAVLRF